MLAFIDESGHPHPNDPSRRPVVVAVCFDERQGRPIAARIHGLKRDYLMGERKELKANKLVNRRTLRRKPEFGHFLEAFYETILNLPVTIFAVIMEAPFSGKPPNGEFLPNRFRYLVQRIELLADEQDTMATIMMDGSAGLFGGLAWQFNGFLYRSQEGLAQTHITDVPAFVDSTASAGIQIADMAAGVIRQYEEAELFKGLSTTGDTYLLTIRRWYNHIQKKTRDFGTEDGFIRYGFHRMPPGSG